MLHHIDVIIPCYWPMIRTEIVIYSRFYTTHFAYHCPKIKFYHCSFRTIAKKTKGTTAKFQDAYYKGI